MKKIIFIAIVGFTGQETIDHRVLVAPVKIETRDYPLPVRAQVHGDIRQIGVIEQAAVCDRRLIIFGKINPRMVENTGLIQGLRNGTYDFELDLDKVRTTLDDGVLRLHTWRVAAVTVGTDAVWRLPRPVIEEMDVKEKIDA